MKTVSIINTKGGVGKSTIAFNLANYLSLNNKKILTLDYDPIGGFSRMLIKLYKQQNKTDNRTYQEIANLDNEKALATYLLKSKNESPEFTKIISNEQSIELLSSDPNQSIVESQIAGFGAEQLLMKSLQPYNNIYDYVVIDTAGAVGNCIYNSMLASDKIIIPIVPSSLAVSQMDDLIEMLSSLSELKVQLGLDKPEVYILLNRAEEKTKSFDKNLADIFEKSNGSIIVDNSIRRTIQIENAHDEGVSIFDKKYNSSKVQEDYRKAFIQILDVKE